MNRSIQRHGFDPSEVLPTWEQPPPPDDVRPLDLGRVFSIFRRWLWLFALIVIAALAAGAYLTFSQVPTYTATGSVVIDQRKQNLINNDVTQVLSDMPEDSSVVDTEAEVLRSPALAAKVVDQLGLLNDPDFGPETPSWFKQTQAWVFANLRGLLQPENDDEPAIDPALAKENARQQVVQNVINDLDISRSGTTNLIYVSFDSEDPVKAARITNAFMNQFLTMGLDVKYDATKRVNLWLSSRLSGLRDQVQNAEAKVAVYRAEHNLLSAQGATLTEQEVTGLDQQYAVARADQAEAEARLSTARAQLSRGSTGEDITATLDSPVIQAIRAQMTAVNQNLAQLQTRYGPKFPDLIKARKQRDDLNAQLHSEIRRIISNLESQAVVARQRTQSVASSLDRLRGTLANNNAASVHLNELQRDADAAKTLYQAFLEQFKQTSSLEGIADVEERIVALAQLPTVPSAPKTMLNLALALALGILAGLGALLLAEAMSTSVLTAEDIERDVQLPCLASIPRLGGRWRRLFKQTKPVRAMRLVARKPDSAFAEGLRALRNALWLGQPDGAGAHVVAICSALPREGKTTVAACLAAIAARSGTKAVVVDCDLRQRGLSKAFARSAKHGIVEVLQGTVGLDEALIHDESRGLAYLPVAQSSNTALDILNMEAMGRLIDELRERFDFVVLDTPPVLPVADATVVSTKADVTVVLARWRKSPRGAVKAAVKILHAADIAVAGVVLTNVNLRKQAKFGYGDPNFYFNYYKSYYGLSETAHPRIGYDKSTSG